MPVEEVKEYLKKWGWSERVLKIEESCATVDLAAAALGVVPGRIAKSITFVDSLAKAPSSAPAPDSAPEGEGREDSSNNACKPWGCILVVASGDRRIDNAKFRAQFGFKATMLKPEEALALTGHAVGGVCPFAISNEAVKIYLDASLKRFDLIYPAAGSSNSLASFTCDELLTCSGALGWVDVCKDE